MTVWGNEAFSGNVWTIVLAGGDGEQMNPLLQRWLGRHRPKQYCSFVGTRSMFQHTLDRAAKVTAPSRTVIVAARGHETEVRAQLADRTLGKVLFQPRNCDTAAGIYLPLTYVRAVDPNATVILFPSDHFIYPENRFLWRVHQALETADDCRDRIVLLGGKPDRLELDYGWIKPGSKLIEDVAGRDVQEVQEFVEKPDLFQADDAMRKGALWNTLVLAARVDTLWRLGCQCVPDIMERFDRLESAIGQPQETAVLQEIYRGMPTRNFSSAVLQVVPVSISVVELAGVLWSDWGKPERIVETLRRINRRPAFPLDCLPHPFAPRSANHSEDRTGLRP